ncbi:triose-phosphate isomerase [Flavobacteriaceae bacterium F08102]|nr:triose-phosphate isomerase [Flavobacteriaceae bacterium F08102]
MRKKIVAGNWKMNNDLQASISLVNEIKSGLSSMELSSTEVMIAPTFVNLHAVTKLVEGTAITVAAQNMHFAEKGAYTGEISAKMLQSVGVNTVILGHSERRAYFHEDATMLAKKVEQALEHQMKVIFCLGEQLEDRKADQHFNVVEYQLKDALFQLNDADWQDIVLAYEPVWAIGTGETARPEQAQEMHAFIRNLIAEQYDEKLAEEVHILYGGSVKPTNAVEIFSQKDVDGGLIGGASLNATDFLAIVNAV